MIQQSVTYMGLGSCFHLPSIAPQDSGYLHLQVSLRSPRRFKVGELIFATFGAIIYIAYSFNSNRRLDTSDLDKDLLTKLQADGLYVNDGQANSITSAMIVDGAITDTKITRGLDNFRMV